MRQVGAKIIIVLFTLGLCIAIFEAGLRITGRTPSNTVEGFFEQHGTSYRLRKNMTKVIKWPSFTYVTITNSFGFRDKQTGDRKIEDRKYDVFIGDSATFANGVNYEESFAGVYDAQSTQRDHIQALNLAVGGHGLKSQMELFKEFTGSVKERPRRVVFCLDPNMMLSTVDTSDPNILVINGYLFEKNAWLLPYLKVTLANLSSVYCFFRDGIRAVQSKRTNANDAQIQEYLNMYSTQRNMGESDGYLDSMIGFCRGMGASVAFVYLPLTIDHTLRDVFASGKIDADRYDLRLYSEYLDRYCKARKVEYIDLSPFLDAYYKENGSLSFTLDAHFNQRASKAIGEYIFENIR